MSCAKPDSGTDRPISVIASLNGSRSSAVRIASMLGADELDAELRRERPASASCIGEVERRLAAHRRQERVGALPLDDRREHVVLERLDVGPVREVRVGHDRRRVRVREDDPVALLAEHPAGLGARVVELARLADDDRAGADDEDRRDVVAPRHQRASTARCASMSVRELARTGSGRRAARGRPRGGTGR